MIPIDTPVGVEIVCIEGISGPDNEDVVVVGEVYVLRGHFMCVLSGAHGVLVDGARFFDNRGREWGFDPSHFRLLEKPVELYSLLERAPVKETV